MSIQSESRRPARGHRSRRVVGAVIVATVVLVGGVVALLVPTAGSAAGLGAVKPVSRTVAPRGMQSVLRAANRPRRKATKTRAPRPTTTTVPPTTTTTVPPTTTTTSPV